MLAFFESLSNFIDKLNTRIGHAVSWLCFFMVVVTFGIVIMRYVFNMGSILIQESVIYMYAFVFMLGAGYTYLVGGHVRVDIFFKRHSKRKQAKIDIGGNIFLLLTTMGTILYLSLPYVMFSWKYLEGSKDAGGLDLVFILKTAIPVMAVLLGLQAISEIIKNVKKL